MKWLAATIIIAAAAQAAQTNWPSAKAQPVEQAEKAKSVVVDRFKLKAEKKVDKDGKQQQREFRTMFDIAQRAQKHKAKKAKEEKEKKSK